jgi:hypothetical protein
VKSASPASASVSTLTALDPGHRSVPHSHACMIASAPGVPASGTLRRRRRLVPRS